MPTEFQRPTLAEIFARNQADLEGEAVGITARLRRRFERALAWCIATTADGIYGHQAWIAEQIFPHHMVERFLLRYAAMRGIEQKASVRSAGNATATGTGGTIPLDALLTRRSDGRQYTVLAQYTGVASTTIAIRAVLGGEDGDCDVGQVLQFAVSHPDVVSTVTVAAGGISGGTDTESLASVLERLLAKLRKPPKGGTVADHIAWAREVSFVTRAWAYKGVDGVGNPGLGNVSLTFVIDEEDGTVTIPDAGQLAEVQNYLTDRSPANAIVFEATPVPWATTLRVTPNTDAAKTAVREAIKDFLSREGEPGTTVDISRYEESISNAEGETSHETVSPTADVEYAFGEFPVYDAGSVTFLD